MSKDDIAPSGLHHHVQDLISITDEAVRKWTKLALWLGIRYNGEYGYDFRSIRKDRLGAPFRPARKTRERSEAARKRRADSKRSSRWLKKSFRPVSISEPLVVRPSISCSKLRRGWRLALRRGESLSFTEYRLRTYNPPVLSLAVGPAAQVPALVELAVRKIYSRVEYFDPTVPKSEFPTTRSWTEPREYRVRYNVSVRDVQYQRILEQIQDLEEQGFPDTARWFELNHELERLRSNRYIVPYVYTARDDG